MPFLNHDDPSRSIYEYSNGTKTIKADPAVVWRKLNAACAEAGKTWDSLSSEWLQYSGKPENLTPEQLTINNSALLDFQGIVAAIAYKAFGMNPIDEEGNGVTETFMINVLGDFIEDREKKEPSTETLPFTSESSDGVLPDTSKVSSVAPSTTSSPMGSLLTPKLPQQPMEPRSSRRSKRHSGRPPIQS